MPKIADTNPGAVYWSTGIIPMWNLQYASTYLIIKRIKNKERIRLMHFWMYYKLMTI